MRRRRGAGRVLFCCLLASLHSLAAPPPVETTPPAQAGKAIPEAPSRFGVDSGRARDALMTGRSFKRRGDLLRAIRAYQEAYLYSARDSYIRAEAQEELHFNLPLMRVHQLMLAGDRNEAITIVKRLQAFHSEDAKRQQLLSDVLARVQDPNFLPVPKPRPASVEQVVAQIRQVLERYRREHDGYPHGYSELNELLPANTPPLQQFDITRYRRSGSGYSLELRAKRPPHNTYNIEKTGLLR